PFDRGASWIHGPNGNPLTTLASRAGAKTFETDDDNVVVYDLDGRAYSDDRISSAEDLYNDVLDRISDLGDIDDSFLDVFRKNYPGYLNDRLWKYMLSAFLEFNSGGDISKLSSLYFDDDENFSGDDVIIT
ncbi:amine oxidase, partial [Pseudomonas sp. Fl4BN2]|nr:amine oxidase [Pseudomonas sp. Fl4BN2]